MHTKCVLLKKKIIVSVLRELRPFSAALLLFPHTPSPHDELRPFSAALSLFPHTPSTHDELLLTAPSQVEGHGSAETLPRVPRQNVENVRVDAATTGEFECCQSCYGRAQCQSCYGRAQRSFDFLEKNLCAKIN